MLHMREFGVMGFGTVLLNFWPKCMNIMGLCNVYVVIMQIWGWRPILRLSYVCNVGTMWSKLN